LARGYRSYRNEPPEGPDGSINCTLTVTDGSGNTITQTAQAAGNYNIDHAQICNEPAIFGGYLG
jgi:hypothetical protein